MKNIESIGGGEMPVEEKAEILSELMYKMQPDFEDFRGAKGFSDYDLRRDQQRLKDKNWRDGGRFKSESAEDRYAKEAEPIVTYVLNHGSFLPSRETYAYLASEFDDKFNGTDVVFGVEKKGGGSYTVFSIDVATGTSADSIEKKFSVSERNGWVAEVDYCMRDDARWSEVEAPHFVLGMMPANLDAAAEKVRIGEGTIVREPDPKTDFILASEIYEQIKMQIVDIKLGFQDEVAKQQLAKLEELMPAIKTKLYRVCKVEGGTKEEKARDFAKKYTGKVREMGEDLVYRNIFMEVQRINKRNNGRKAMAGVRVG